MCKERSKLQKLKKQKLIYTIHYIKLKLMQQFMQNSAELTQYANDMQYIKMIKKIVVTFLIVINICEIYSFVVS